MYIYIMIHILQIMVKDTFIFTPDVLDIKKIDRIVAEIGRYGSREEFLREAVDLMTMWWTKPEEMFVKSQEMWVDYTPEMKRTIRKNSPEFYERMENPTGPVNKSITYLEEFAKNVQINREILKPEKVPICKECISSSSPPLMNKLQTRFFPSKIVTCLLAKAVIENMNVNNNEWIDYELFRKNSCEEILEITKILKQYEEENNVTRSKRISTGLPAFHEKTFENKEEELKNILKSKQVRKDFWSSL